MNETEIPPAEHYRIYRDYLQHEDGLVNHRLSWSLTTNSLLFAAFGYNLHTTPPPGLETASALLGQLLPIIGATVSYLSWLSIRAALSAIDQLTRSWKSIYDGLPKGRPVLPELSGGNSAFAKRHGKHAPLYTAGAFVVFWVTITLTLLWLGYPAKVLHGR